MQGTETAGIAVTSGWLRELADACNDDVFIGV